jgi:hypothetical protein
MWVWTVARFGVIAAWHSVMLVLPSAAVLLADGTTVVRLAATVSRVLFMWSGELVS